MNEESDILRNVDEELDIRVELRFTGAKSYPARLIIGVTEAVERAIARVEAMEIDELEIEFGDIPKTVFDAMRYRAERTNGRALNIESASSGSIILGGTVVVLALWFLNTTLGETIKEAWKESEMHARVKTLLLANISDKAKKIAQMILPSRFSSDEASVETSVETVNGITTIIVVAFPGPALLPLPKASEILALKK